MDDAAERPGGSGMRTDVRRDERLLGEAEASPSRASAEPRRLRGGVDGWLGWKLRL